MSLQPFRGKGEGRRKDNTLLANSAALSTAMVSNLHPYLNGNPTSSGML